MGDRQGVYVTRKTFRRPRSVCHCRCHVLDCVPLSPVLGFILEGRRFSRWDDSLLLLVGAVASVEPHFHFFCGEPLRASRERVIGSGKNFVRQITQEHNYHATFSKPYNNKKTVSKKNHARLRLCISQKKNTKIGLPKPRNPLFISRQRRRPQRTLLRR